MKRLFNSKLFRKIFAISLFPPAPGCLDASGNPTGETGWQCLELIHIPEMLEHIIKLFMDLLGAVAVIMLIWGAYQYLTAYGNDEQAQKAKSTIYWAIIGVAVAVLAWVLVDTLWGLLTGGPAPVGP